MLSCSQKYSVTCILIEHATCFGVTKKGGKMGGGNETFWEEAFELVFEG